MTKETVTQRARQPAPVLLAAAYLDTVTLSGGAQTIDLMELDP